MKPLLVLGMLVAAGGGCVAAGNVSCNQGWELCPSTQQCVHRQCMNLITQESESHECQDGQVYCDAMEACVQPCFTSSTETCSINSLSSVCPSGRVCCQKDASKTCTTPEDCERSSGFHLPSPTCPDGYIFCLSVGGCVVGECPSVSDGTHCDSNKIFCPSLGRCVSERECSGTNVIEEAAFTCPPGKIVCMSTGKCEEAWACGENLGDRGGEICPPHKPVFCLASRTCEIAGGCSSRPPETMARICPREYIYCAQRRECVARSRGCSEPSVRKPLLSCPHGTSFSIPSGTCVPNSENGQTLTGERKSCPSGSVFSLSSGTCVPDPARKRKKMTCPPGTVYHLTEGNCVQDPVMYDDTPNWTCPMANDSRQDSFTYSTCITSNHCSTGLSCCPDPETWHFQCVNTDGEQDPSALNRTCQQLEKAKHDTTLRCNSPHECPQASVCCGGKCRSHDGVASCPIGTLFCTATNACERLGKQCGKVCPPKHVLCSASSDCVIWSSCESGRSMSGAPWLMPDIKWVSATSNNSHTWKEVLLSETFKAASTAFRDRSIVIFIITNFTSAYGSWYFRQYQSSPWIPLSLTSEITAAHYLQYRPLSNLYEFGLDYINMTEAGTGIDRTVVQLVAPESPTIQMKKVVSTITTEEDVPKEFSLWSIINVTCNDTHYWRVWMQAADFPKQAAKANLLQFNSKNVMLWVTLLQSPGLQNNIGEDGVMGRGLKLEWMKNSSSSDEVLADLFISLSEGKEWFRMNPRKALKLPIVSCEKVQDIMVKVQPNLNSYGTRVLRPSVYPSKLINDSTNMSQDEDMNDIVLKVTSVNDLPVARTYPEFSKIPALRVGQPNNGVPVETYAEAFFQDPENAALGIVIFQALSGPDGDAWQYSVDDGKTFNDIMDLKENTFDLPLSVREARQGAFNWRKEIERVNCNFKDLINNIDDLSVSEDSACLMETRKRMGRRLGRGTRRSFNTRTKTQTLDTAAIAEFGYSGTGNLSLTGPDTKRKVLYLPPKTLLRYNTSRNAWTKDEAFRDTRLMFVIWDTNATDPSLREVKWMNISLKEDLGQNGLGRDPVVTAMTWQDCTNQTLEMNQPRTVDACGKCGGNNRTCTDCAGVLNGSATLVCGECVGGTTNKTREKDCAGQCEMKNHLVTVNGEQHCLLANRTYCDGLPTSGAYFDRCGVCVGGSTDLKPNEVMDDCDECYGTNTCYGCDGVPRSGKVMDKCGQCLTPDTPGFNNCSTLTANTKVLDAAVNDLADVSIQSRSSASQAGGRDSPRRQLQSLLTVKAQVTGLTAKRYKVECWLEADSDQISNATRVLYANGQLKATFKILLSGIQSFKCTFTPAKKKRASSMTLESETKVEVMDSRTAMLETDTTLVETSRDRQINLTVTNAPSLDFAKCFLLYQDSAKGGRKRSIVIELDTEVITEDQVACTVSRLTRPGEPQLGVALTPTAVKAMYLSPLNLQMKRITIMSPAPQVMSAVLNHYGDVLLIKFDQNIEIDTNCSAIILWPWASNNDRQAPTCQVLGAKVKIRLGPDISIEANTTLNFTTPGTIRTANGNPLTSPSASGGFVVVQPKQQKEVTFHLSGDTKACNTSEVTISISRIRGAKIKDLEPEWNITWEPSTTLQAETVLVWKSLSNLKEAMKQETKGRRLLLRLPGNEFLEGVEYMINVYLKLSNGELTSTKSVTVTTMPSEEALRVTVSGPSVVMADQPNSYQAIVTPCSDTMMKKNTKYKYIWSVLGGRALNVFQGKRITLPPGTLVATQNQTLVVNVKALEQEATGIASLDLSVIPQGISVVTSATFLRMCSNTAIIVDASNSKDRDNRPGSISFRWKCSSNMSNPCIVIGKTLTGLESVLPEEEMRKPTLTIPARYLPPGRYTLTVIVNKGRSSAQKDVEVEVLRSNCDIIVETKPTSVLVNPMQEIIIPAYVTGPAKLYVQWQSIEESGFQNVETMTSVDGGQPTFYEDSSEQRQQFLQLPKPTQEEFVGLMMGETYKFRLKVWTDTGDTIFNDVILRTPHSQLEEKATLEVSPTTGVGILDNFTFTMKYSVDSIKDQPSTVYYGYRFQDSQDIWFIPVTNEDPAAVYQLPARSNQEKLTPIMKVCDSFGICQREEGDTITLNLPSQLPPGLLGNLVNSFDNDMRCDECLKSALKKITDNLATIMAMNYSTAAAALTEAIEMSIISELPNLITRTQNKPSLSLDILEGLLGFVQEFGASPDLQQLWGTLAWESFSKNFGLPSPDINYSPAETNEDKVNEEFIYYPKTDEDLKDARNGYKSLTSELSSTDINNQPVKQRVKRQVTATNEEQEQEQRGQFTTTKEKDDRKPMTVDETRIYLQTFETMVTEANPDTAKSHLKNLLDSLPLMMSDLCLLTTTAPKQVVGDLVTITVAPPDLKDQADQRFFFKEKNADEPAHVQKKNFVVFGDVLLDYEQWSCKAMDGSGNGLCYGACPATVLLKDNFWSLVTGARIPGSLRTSIAGGFLLNPESGAEIPVTSEARILYHIKMNNSTTPAGYRIECFAWSDQEWDSTICNTGMNEVFGKVKKLVCYCKKTAYVAGFLVKVSITPRITAPSIEEEPAEQALDFAPPPIRDKKHVVIIIHADYDEVVGINKTVLEEEWTTQISESLSIPKSSIYNLTISKGSIKVEFDILPSYTRTSSKPPSDVFGNLYELVNSGTLTLTGLSNEEFPVLPQALDGSGPLVEEKKDPTKLPLIIGAVVGAIVLIVIVFICFAIYFKNKKKMDKVQPLQMGDTKQPTYSSVYFEQMLDGTIASLAKQSNSSNRSLSSGGSYADEGIYIERRATPSSRDGSGSKSRGNLSQDSGLDEVPEPFQYNSPSKEQLENSGAIPEHIFQKIEASADGLLPGSPEEPVTVHHKW